MISSLVSSILSNITPSTGTAERIQAQQAQQDTNRPAMGAVIAAKPVANRPINPVVTHGGATGQVDYFHSAKHMIGTALGKFGDDVRDAFGGLGFEDGMAGKLTEAVMHQTKNALLWGVGFSVKLMTATVAQTQNAEATSFSVTARSIEIKINHSTGVIDVDTGKVSIESRDTGIPGAEEPHLLDIHDSDNRASDSLIAALNALNDPESLFEDDDVLIDESVIDIALDADRDSLNAITEDIQTAGQAASDVRAEDLPRVDTPAVLTRPEYGSRIIITAMEHFLDDRKDLVTYMRLDAVIPLSSPSYRSEDVVSAV